MASWVVFHLLWECTFLGFDRSSLGPSSSELYPNGLRGVKKMVCLPSLLSRPPAMNPHVKIEVTLNEHPLWNRNSFHLYGIATWPVNSGAIKFPTVCPWMARIYNKEFLEIHAILEPHLVASSINWLKPIRVQNFFALPTSEMLSAVLEP